MHAILEIPKTILNLVIGWMIKLEKLIKHKRVNKSDPQGFKSARYNYKYGIISRCISYEKENSCNYRSNALDYSSALNVFWILSFI